MTIALDREAFAQERARALGGVTTDEAIAGLRNTPCKKENVESIKFVAEVAKVTTTTDGGIRVVLDLDEKGCAVMRVLAECQQNGVALDIEAIPRV